MAAPDYIMLPYIALCPSSQPTTLGLFSSLHVTGEGMVLCIPLFSAQCVVNNSAMNIDIFFWHWHWHGHQSTCPSIFCKSPNGNGDNGSPRIWRYHYLLFYVKAIFQGYVMLTTSYYFTDIVLSLASWLFCHQDEWPMTSNSTYATYTTLAP